MFVKALKWNADESILRNFKISFCKMLHFHQTSGTLIPENYFSLPKLDVRFQSGIIKKVIRDAFQILLFICN